MKELQLFAGIVCAIYAVLFGDFLWREWRVGLVRPTPTDGTLLRLIARACVVLVIAAMDILAFLLIRAGLS